MKTIATQIPDIRIDAAIDRPSKTDLAPTRELYFAFQRQKWLLAFWILIGLVAGVAHYLTSPPKFFASAEILVDERTSDLTDELTASLPLLRDDTAVLNEMRVLRSLNLAKVVVRNMELHENVAFLDPPVSSARTWISSMVEFANALVPRLTEDRVEPTRELNATAESELHIERAAIALQRELEVNQVGRSFSIEISMLSHDPALAAGLVNAYSEAYLSDRLNANLKGSERRAEWMRARLDDLRRAANEATRDAEQYRAENRVKDVAGLRELEARAETLNTLHQTVLARYEQIAIEGSFPVTNGRVLTSAVVAKEAALPQAWKLLSVGAVLGLMIGFVFAVLKERREQAFRTGADVRALTDLPFLGYLPTFSVRRFSRWKPITRRGRPDEETVRFISSRRSGIGGSGSSWILDEDRVVPFLKRSSSNVGHFVAKYFIPALVPQSRYCETLKNVLATLDLALPDRGSKVVAFTGLEPGDGATTTATNFANMMALHGETTILIDANPTDPAVSQSLGRSSEPSSNDDAGMKDEPPRYDICALPFTGLDVLCFETRDDQRASMSGSNHRDLSNLIAEKREQYDYVVLDTPALTSSSDVKVLLGRLDGIVIVCRWGITQKDLVRQYLEQEPEIARKTTGILLNRTNFKKLWKFGVSQASGGIFLNPAKI